MPANADRGPVVITGGSGFLGLSLATHLASKGWSAVILSRRPPRREGPWRHVSWDARNLGEWIRTLEGASGLVNPVGRNCRTQPRSRCCRIKDPNSQNTQSVIREKQPS
jgi:nucleoside-diphosphate-sugar epimerase